MAIILTMEVNMKLSVIVMSLLLFLAACSPYGNLTTMEFEDLNYPYPVNYLKLEDGRSIAYVDEGKGKHTIIFVHG